MRSIKTYAKVLAVLMILFALLAAAGCTAQSPASSASATASVAASQAEVASTALASVAASTSAAASPAPGTAVYTDMLGRQVTLSTNIKKVALIRTMDIYMLSAILGKDLDTELVAVGQSFKETDIDGYNKLSSIYKNLDNMTNLGSIYDDAISIETVMNLKPDIIIVDKQFSTAACINKMIQAGLPVVFTDDNTDPFHGILKSMQMLGKMLGKEQQVDAMVADANQKTDALLKKVSDLESTGVQKPKLYFECGNVDPTQFGGTRGDESNGWGLVWKTLGADNIGVGNGSNPMNPEQVLTANPDVIIIGGANWNPTGNIMRMGYSATQEKASEHLGLYTQRAGWSDLKAIKNSRLYSLHFNIFVYPYNFAGVEAMAKMLYPTQFSDLDPTKDMQDFFAKYIPYSYSGTFWANWK